MTLTLLSQNMRKEQKIFKISKPALTLIKKDLQYCDSLKIAYTFKSKELENLTRRNSVLFSQLSKENEKSILLQNQIEKQQKEILKINKNSNNCLLYGVTGGVVGLIIGVIIAK